VRAFMRMALSEAQAAKEEGSVPVGCIIVKEGAVIARAHNDSKNPLAHAEMEALALAPGRLDGCEIYVTLEPCPMCAWAIALSGMKKVVFGAYDMDYGACGSAYSLLANTRLASIECYGGILEEEASALLRAFFKGLRQ